MGRRRIIVIFSALLLVSLFMLAYLLPQKFWHSVFDNSPPPPPAPIPSKATFDKVRMGMTQREVEAIVGESLAKIGYTGPLVVLSYRSEEGVLFNIVFGAKSRSVCAKIWYSDSPIEFHKPGWETND